MRMDELRELLSKRRAEAGMSARSLARSMQVTPTTIGNWESGKTEPKSFEELQRWAGFFGVNVALTTVSEEDDHLAAAVGLLKAVAPDAVSAVAAYARALAEADDRSRTLLVAQATAAMAFVTASTQPKKTGTGE